MRTERDRLEARAETVARADPCFDDRGDVVGPRGLTIGKPVPTPTIDVESRRLSAWCAWDALFLPEIIGAGARVESTHPVTRETVALVLRPDGVAETSHPKAVVSFEVGRLVNGESFPSLAGERR